MFNRIFQDNEGCVEEITGLKVSNLKAIIDQENGGNIILIWIGVNNNSDWYRIFIDGCYSGIDQFKEDLSNEDSDEDIICVEYNWINDEIIINAKVELGNKSL